MNITADGEARIQCCGELWPDADLACHLDLSLSKPCPPALVNQVLEVVRIEGVENVAEPLSVRMIPLVFIREVLHYGSLLLGIGD